MLEVKNKCYCSGQDSSAVTVVAVTKSATKTAECDFHPTLFQNVHLHSTDITTFQDLLIVQMRQSSIFLR